MTNVGDISMLSFNLWSIFKIARFLHYRYPDVYEEKIENSAPHGIESHVRF